MPIKRNQRTYPLAIKTADAMMTGVACAFDFAGNVSNSNAQGFGADHSGNSRNLTQTTPGTVITIDGPNGVYGVDCSKGKTLQTNSFVAAGAAAIGMNVGTGDFTIWIRARMPSAAPAANKIITFFKVGDSGGTKQQLDIYEVTNDAKYHAYKSSTEMNWSDDPGVATGVVQDFVITRVGGVRKWFTGGVLRKTNASDTSNIGAGGVASAVSIGPSGVNVNDVALIDSVMWTRGLSDTEVATFCADPYAYWDNSAAAPSITITSPLTGATVGTSINIAGTIDGGSPTALEASFNGGAWADIVSSPGASWTGTLTGQTPGTGNLIVRWKSNTAISATITNLTVTAASIAFKPWASLSAAQKVQAAAHTRVFQRDPVTLNSSSVRILLDTIGSPTAIEWRWAGGTWATLDAAPAGGTVDKTVTLTGLKWGALEVRFANNTSVTASIDVSVGKVFLGGGQSNHVGMSSIYVPPSMRPGWHASIYDKASNWRDNVESAVLPFDDRTNTTRPGDYPAQTVLGSYFGKLASLLDADGIPVAIVPCALGSQGISAWPWSGTTGLYYAQRMRAEEVGDHEGVLWWQGEQDMQAATVPSTYAASLSGMINDWYVRYNRKWAILIPDGVGTGGTAQSISDIRAAILGVAQSAEGVASYADLAGKYTGSVHYDSASEIDAIADAVFPLTKTFLGMPPGQITGLGGIASEEAFGALAVSGGATASITGLGGIASGESFGALAVSTGSSASIAGLGGIGSGEAFGALTVSASSVSPSASITGLGGIASGLAFGSIVLAVTLDPSFVTLIVETGAGIVDAESYASTATADAYHAARGNTAWASLTQLQKEIALRKATDYMQQQYGGKWSGIRLSSSQALDWPRSNVRRDGYELPSAPLPREIVRACCELALRASTSALTSDAGPQVVREKVGAIEVEYANGARQQIKFAAVENLLRPLMSSAGSGLTFVRS